MSSLLYAGATSLLFSFLLMPMLVRFLQSRKLMDEGNHRKIHSGFRPSMGGIVIVVAFVAAMLFWLPIDNIVSRRYEFAALALVFFAGIRDDVMPLKPLHKLTVQLVAASILVLLGDIRIPSLYGFLGIYELPGVVSWVLSILLIIAITNAFNLIDGIDGLAASVATVSLSFLAFWFYGIGNYSLALCLVCVIGALLGFLYYNWQPASIFMGDTGSLSIGLILSFCTLSFIKTNGELQFGNTLHFSAVLTAGIIIVLLPLYDTTRVFLHRLQRGKSPFTPDKLHTHHLILYTQKKSHAKAVVRIIGAYLLMAVPLLIACYHLPDNVLLPSLLVEYYAVTWLLGKAIKKNIRKKRNENHRLVEQEYLREEEQ